MRWHKLKDKKPKDGQLCLVWCARGEYPYVIIWRGGVNYIPRFKHWAGMRSPDYRRPFKPKPPIVYGRKR